MNFKEWMMLVEDGDSGTTDDDDSLILLGHPAYASDSGKSLSSAREFQIFRQRLNNTKKFGNPLINLDIKKLNAVQIVSPENKTLPSGAPWKHKPDDPRKPNETFNKSGD